MTRKRFAVFCIILSLIAISIFGSLIKSYAGGETTVSKDKVSHIQANNPPVAMPDVIFVDAPFNTNFFGRLTNNDFDPDGDQIEATWANDICNPSNTSDACPKHGALFNIQGVGFIYSWTDPNYVGIDSFKYKVFDRPNGTFSSVVTVILIIGFGDGANAGPTKCNTKVGKPVNVTDGNMYLQQTDYSLPGVGSAVNVTRTYNSTNQTTGLFGRGWSTLYDQSIQSYPNSANGTELLLLNMGDGRTAYFVKDSASTSFVSYSPNIYGQIVRNTDSSYTVTMKDGSVEQFDATGRLLSMKDRNNNQTTLTYLVDGKIRVEDPFGKTLTLTTTNGLVTQISDKLNGVDTPVANYTYYSNSTKLQTVLYQDGSKYDFSYDETSNPGKVLLTEVKDAQNKIVEKHEYYPSSHQHAGKAKTSEIAGSMEKYTLEYPTSTQNFTKVIDLRGNESQFYFTEINRRKFVTKVVGLCSCGGSSSQTSEWEYIGQGNVKKQKNALGQETTYTYDTNGNMLTMSDIYGTETYTYNSFGQVLTYKDRLNNTTTVEYNASGNPTKIISPSPFSYETKFEYHPNGKGLLTKLISPRSTTNYTVETEINWDTTNGVINWIKDAKGNQTSFTFDARRRVKTVTNAKSEVTSYNYDNLENTTREFVITLPDAKTVKYKYDSRRLIDTITDVRGKVSDYNFDDQYRLASMTDALNHTTTYGYDTMSNLTSVTNAKGEVTNYDYDEFNRLKEIKYPPANTGDARLTETIKYDGIGRLTEYRDTATRLTTYAYFDSTKKYSVTNPENETTEIEYDARFETIKVKDAKLQVYEFEYDQLGRLTSQTRGGQTMSYQYDEAGNRKQRTDYNGLVTKYVYDKADNLEKIYAVNPVDNVSEMDTSTYGYDTLNRLITAANYAGIVEITYDNRGRVATVKDVFDKTITYGYVETAAENKKTLTFGSEVTTYEFDNANRLTKITDPASGEYLFGYDVVNRMTSRTMPNGVTTTADYDGLGRMKFWKNVSTSAGTLNDYTYGYTNLPRIESIAEPSKTRSFTYDNTDRLKTTDTNGTQTENYNYDVVGNRTSSHLSTTYGYQTGTFNRLTSTRQATYSHDANGNTTSKGDSNQRWTYTYDSENRLIRATRFGASPLSNRTVHYQYDALGRRVSRQEKKTGLTKFTYDGMDVLQDRVEKSDGTTSTTDYVNGLGIDDKLKQTSGSTSKYFLTDHLGSTVGLSDTSGSVTESATYDSFGNKTGTLSTRYGYTGREQDETTGLMYYRARQYDPQVGRFTSEDPIGFKGRNVNLYGYVKNRPLRLRDPLGLVEHDPTAPVDLGLGWRGRVDIFNSGEGFEIHVYRPNGDEAGVVSGKYGWLEKHGHTGAIPNGIPEPVLNRINGINVDELRARGEIPPKGTAPPEGDIKGGKYLYPGRTLFSMLNIITIIFPIIEEYQMECELEERARRNGLSSEEQIWFDSASAGHPEFLMTPFGPMRNRHAGGYNKPASLLPML